MTVPIRVLFIEDSPDDSLLFLRELENAGYEVTHLRVEDESEMRRALSEHTWDLILSDFSLPTFDAAGSLRVYRESGQDIPFMVVSGTIGEEHAVSALKAGAHDFLVKGRLARFVPAVQRELREAAMRREQRKLQEQLMVSDRMASVGILAAGVAHEINNPLAAVFGNIQFAVNTLQELMAVQGTGRQLDELQAGLRDALEAAERVRHIVHDLKVFSRAQEEQYKPVCVERVIDSTLRMAWNEIRHRARFVKDVSALPPVLGNEARLGQVLLNLLVNAAQAIPEGRADENEIRLSAFVHSGHVILEVTDTGSGMPPEVQRRLFTPFFTTKPVGVGTGLGLSVCQRIISQHGGAISVESAVDKGSTFRVSLPAAEGAEVPEPSEPKSVPARAHRRGRVLIVDDEPMIGHLVRRALSSEHDVTALTSAIEALERIRSGERFDVILSDLMMPRMTGMDFHQELGGLAPELADRIIFLTGGSFTPRARAFLEQAPNERLEKPFDVPALRALVNAHVR